jgi:hypothetical protein
MSRWAFILQDYYLTGTGTHAGDGEKKGRCNS